MRHPRRRLSLGDFHPVAFVIGTGNQGRIEAFSTGRTRRDAQCSLRRRLPDYLWKSSRIVVAHPDDETIGCGALLARLDSVSVIAVTDGSPRRGTDARRAGLASPDAYTSARARELGAALAIAGVSARQIVQFSIPDRDSSKAMVEIATDAYEGGHPDHDREALGAMPFETAPCL